MGGCENTHHEDVGEVQVLIGQCAEERIEELVHQIGQLGGARRRAEIAGDSGEEAHEDAE